MTLLVVGIEPPSIESKDSVQDLASALGDLEGSFYSYFISFAVIGRYWIAHHASFALLKGMNRRFISLNMAYLAFIAFVPFPTAVLGDYFENPAAFALYAVTMA